VLITVLAQPADIAKLETILFRETRTLGVRYYTCQRHKYPRQSVEVTTPWGTVRGKLIYPPGEPPRFTPEYEDCARIARQIGQPLVEVLQTVSAHFQLPPTTPPGQENERRPG
jgi:uncharacterized protein (DUF111 family)